MASVMTKARSRREAGAAIREFRLNRGLSPEELGDRVGISGRTIRRVEEGHTQPTVRTMFALALEFDCDVVDLWPPA